MGVKTSLGSHSAVRRRMWSSLEITRWVEFRFFQFMTQWKKKRIFTCFHDRQQKCVRTILSESINCFMHAFPYTCWQSKIIAAKMSPFSRVWAPVGPSATAPCTKTSGCAETMTFQEEGEGVHLDADSTLLTSSLTWLTRRRMNKRMETVWGE